MALSKWAEWEDLHGKFEGPDDSEYSSRDHTVVIKENFNARYRFTGTLLEYRGLPCSFDIEMIELLHYNDDGHLIHVIQLNSAERYLMEQAEKIAVEEY